MLPAVLRQLKVHILAVDDQFRLSLEVLQDIIAIVHKQDPVRGRMWLGSSVIPNLGPP